MYIFVSADGKIAYLYDYVIFICSSDYFVIQGIRLSQGYKKNGVKIIIFKAFCLKILFSVRNW